MTTSFVSRSAPRAGILLSLLALAACNERGAPLAPETTPEQPVLEVAQIKCTASVRSLNVSCAHPALGGDARGLIVGSQNQYVKLTSSNVAYNSGTAQFTFDVTVQNLIPQAMATTDGSTGTATGVRVFFEQDLTVTGGTGNASVANADGTETFTTGNQPYFQYAGADLGADGILATSETSSSKGWVFSIDPTVETFSFLLLVSTDVRFPDGWVEVSPAADTMVAGATQGLTAVVKSAVGNTLSETVSWGTSDAAIATVDAGGTVTGVAPGAATITATAGPRTGEATLAICPDLAVGGVYTAVMPGASSLCFAGGASGAEYTYSPINFSTSAAISLSLTGAGIVPVAGPPSPNIIAGNGPRLSMAVTSDDDRHLATMERERRELEPVLRNPASRIERARRGGRDGARFLITPGVPAVGDIWSLNVAQGCTGTPEFRAARVMSVGTNVIVVADTTNPAGGFTSAQYDSIAAEFDSLAYATDTINFGAPTDLDTNGRVVAFYTRAVNQLSPPASSSVVSGYFTARDLFSAAPGSCTLSNQGEIFYMLVPDPTGVVNSNVRTVASVRSGTVATMAHELQHLINASRRVYVQGTQTFEQVWLNEGLSHIAEELVFYRITGLTPRSNVSLSTIVASNARISAYNAYMSQNFGRYRNYLARPDTAGPIKNSDALAVRGAIFSFLRYAADRRNDNDAALWHSLVNTTLTGTANLQNALGSDPNDWVRDWIATIYGDDAGIGIGTQYQITSWNFRSVYSGIGTGVYPLHVRPLTNNLALTVSYSRGGGSVMARFGVPTGSFAGVTALSAGAIPATPYALIVTRTK